MTELEVSVDDELCAASALCKRIAPKVFDLPDDADTAVVLMPVVSDPEQVTLTRDAEESCPTQAILIAERP
jgi:ferredoxin